MESVNIKVSKSPNTYEVKMVITKGKVLALREALRQYGAMSPVGQDLYDMVVEKTKDIN